MIKKSNIILGILMILLISQFGFILYLNSTVKNLDNRIIVLDIVLGSLAQELNLTKTDLQGEINEKYSEQQQEISKLTADVVKTQEDLEEQSEQLEDLKITTSSDFSDIIKDTIESVVSIKTDVSQGSGFIVDERGYVITNYHVLNDASFIKVFPYKRSSENAELIGYDSNMDIALLKINGDYDYLRFGDSDNMEVGEKVIAMGNPFGLSFSVTEGIISSLNREGPSGKDVYLQTDVPLNPGNSGGPLINKEGKVIGINNFKIGGAESLGFSLESNQAIATINEIAGNELGETLL